MTANSEKPTVKPPVAKLRSGRITATVWERTSGEETHHSVNFERRYHDRAGNWRSTHSFDFDDLQTLVRLADLTHTEIMNLRYVVTE